ncbi:MAG: T9SS type A sorting domain-containing protein [Bacteroidia bacterium]
MKKLIITLIACCMGLWSYGQSIERQVIGSAGEAVQTGSGGISYTVGQEATASQIIPATKLTQGFQQAGPEEFVGIIDLYTSTVKAIVFPNPTVNILQLRSDLHTQGIDHLDYQILDVHGKLVFSGNIASDGSTIDVSSLAASTYTLVLKSANQNFNQRIRFVKV